MTYEQALEKIQTNWEKLPRVTIEGHEAVWMIESDMSDSYDIDEERIGMKKDGTLIWAYASGCSCWEGDYGVHEFHDPKEIKVFSFQHARVKESWQELIIKFAEAI